MASPAPAAAYRLNWNPDHPDTADDLSPEAVEDCREHGSVDVRWRCGNAKIRAGQRILLLRTGRGPRGIIGSGVALREPEGGDVDDAGDYLSRWVTVRFLVLALTPIIPREALAVPPLDGVKWSSQAAAARLTHEQLDAVDRLLENVRRVEHFRFPEELPPSPTYAEGAAYRIEVNAYERSRAARQACLDAWGTACAVCDLDFGERFGPMFAGLIHVHHLVPLSALSGVAGRYDLDPKADLRPVCPNCHAMLHKKDPPFTIQEGRAWFEV